MSAHNKKDFPIKETRTLKPDKSKEELKNIGPYKLLEVIGKGGMGTVYLAEQQKPIRRKVALKVIRPGMDSKEIVARFESEQQALALMTHPNIAQVYDSGTTEQGYPYFVMEYVPGIPITEYCDKRRMTTEERLRLFENVCDAIQHAHFKGIVHRDLKPSNILVAYQDKKHIPKIIDFGIAKALTGHVLTEKTLHTLQGVAIGTPVYMSPEQAELTGYDIDTRTDVYSLGVMLYELIVGATPFEEKELEKAGLVEILRIIREDEPPKPSTRFNSLGDNSTKVAQKRRTNEAGMLRLLKGDLEWIVMKAIDKDRERRYSSTAELGADINRYLNHETIQARPPSFVYRIKKYVRRNKAASFAVISILILIIAFSFWNILERQKAVKSSKEANYNLALTLKEKAKEYAQEKQWPLFKLFMANSLLYQAKAQKYFSFDDVEIPIEYQDLMLKNSYYIGDRSVWILSPDWRYLASGYGDGTIKIYDPFSGKALYIFKGYEKNVRQMNFSPDGNILATAFNDGTIEIWEVSSGKKIDGLRGHNFGISSLSFNPDGKHLASVDYGGEVVKIWDVFSGNEISVLKAQIKTSFIMGGRDSIEEVCFSPDGRHLATGYNMGIITLWDVDNGIEKTQLEGHKDFIVSIEFTPDGKHLASCDYSGLIKIWDISSVLAVATLKANERTNSVIFSPDGRLLASSDLNNTKIWDFSTGKEIVSLSERAGSSFSPDGKYLATDSLGIIKIWEISSQKVTPSLKGHKGTVYSVCFSPDGRQLASGSGDNTIKIWDVFSGKEISTLRGHKGTVFSLSFTPDGRQLASGSWDNTIKIWDVFHNKEISTLKGHKRSVNSVCFSPDGRQLASGSYDETVKIWDVLSFKEITSLKGHKNLITAVNFSSDGKHLASVDSSGLIKIWDISSDQAIATLKTNEGVYSVTFSPDGRHIASGLNRVINIWEVPSGKKSIVLTGNKELLNAISFSPDGKHLASGDYRGLIKIWDISNGQAIATLKANEGVYSVIFSPDGRLLVSGCEDHTLSLWDLNYYLHYLGFELDYPYKEKDVEDLILEVQNHTGFELEGFIPADANLYRSLGENYAARAEYEKASELYEKALKIVPNFTFALENLGKAHYQMGNYGQALNYLKKAIESNPRDFRTQFYIGLIHLAAGEFEKAYDYYRYVNKEFEVSEYLISSVIQDIDELMINRPDLIFAYLIRGYMYGQSGNLTDAEENINQFINEFRSEEKWKRTAEELLSEIRSNPRVWFNLGAEHLDDEEYEKAIEAYEKGLRIKPDDWVALNNLGWCYYSIEKHDEAIRYFKKAIDIDKKNLAPHFNTALTYLAQGNHTKSYDYYRYIIDELEELRATKDNILYSMTKIDALLKKKPDLHFAYLIRGYLYKETDANLPALINLNLFIMRFEGEEKWRNLGKKMASEVSAMRKRR